VVFNPDGVDSTVARFTVPDTADYSLTAIFTASQEEKDNGAHASIINNTQRMTIMVPTQVSDGNPYVYSGGDLSLMANDVIDIVVARSPGTAKHTQVDVTFQAQ
jgi:hypothetical protein